MQSRFEVPIESKVSSLIRRQRTGLWIMLGFVMLTTGIFIIAYKALWAQLTPQGRKTLTQLPATYPAGIAYLLAAVSLFCILLWRPRLRYSNPMLFVWISIMAISCFFALTYHIFMPGAIYGCMIGLALLSTYQFRTIASASTLIISESGIHIPTTLFPRLIRWSDVSTVLIRHGILTVELRSNELVQFPLSSSANDQVHFVERFCEDQVKVAIPSRKSLDW
jgi:hypothetical protein